ncbi:DUF1654 domain-containing protein [Pseudomonas glycinae]|uniref:DUF1654 domain-containing protein n=1 Tax=Pseudomonas glycinae TaxID=1785145 RepID=UPI002B1DC0E9|nr:DUF1654 domain-containing protein [Pseudomonas glycinae]
MPSTATPAIYSQESYKLVVRRIQRLITSLEVQKVQIVTVNRKDYESLEAWHQVIQEIGETSGVDIQHLDGGAVRIGWRGYYEV